MNRCQYCAGPQKHQSYDGRGCSDLCTERLAAWDRWTKRSQSPAHPMFHGDVNKPYKPTKADRLPPMSDKHAAQVGAYGRKITAEQDQLPLAV